VRGVRDAQAHVQVEVQSERVVLARSRCARHIVDPELAKLQIVFKLLAIFTASIVGVLYIL
jgi:hypothetical protein